MTLSDLQTLIGSLTNDPNHDRYSLTDIGTELDNSQDTFNIEARLIKDTVSVTLVSGTRQYAISGLTGTVIGFARVTHNGLELKKVDKAFMDLYTGTDWTTSQGTPTRYLIEITDPDVQYLTLWVAPDGAAAAFPVIAEYIKRHTPMSLSTDVPFMSGTSSNTLLRPYDQFIAYDVAGRLLKRDPSPVNVPKALSYEQIANRGLADLTQVFKNIEREEPYRLRGGRYWNSGNAQSVK